jgi:hypothetical protein
MFDNRIQIKGPNRRREEINIYLNFNRPYMVRELDSSRTEHWQLLGFCEHDNESSKTITRAKFLDFISCYLFFKASPPRGYCVEVYNFRSAFSVNCITGRRNTIQYL